MYLDNAATSQKPQAVLDVIDEYYAHDNANVHRGIHELSRRATIAYEEARGKVAGWIGADDASEIVWTRGTTDAINLVATAWGLDNVGEGDEILLTVLEHHSNIVPWQILAGRTGAKLRYIELDDQGRLVLDDLAVGGECSVLKTLALVGFDDGGEEPVVGHGGHGPGDRAAGRHGVAHLERHVGRQSGAEPVHAGRTQLEALRTVVVIGVDHRVWPIDHVDRAQNCVEGAPGLGSRRTEIVLANIVDREVPVLGHDLLPDVGLDVAANDQDDVTKPGGNPVFDREVEERLVVRADPGQLFHPAEPAAETGGHDDKEGFA